MLTARSVTPLVLVALFGTVACAGADVLTVEQPRPARSAEAVELLLEAPDRAFQTVAVIRSSNRNLFRSLESLKREVQEAAARVGADAVILSLASQEGADGVGMTAEGQPVYVGGSSELRIVGRAIVFTDH